MSEWVSVKDKLPPQGVLIKIKSEYGDGCVEVEATFYIYDIDEYNEAWGWRMKEENQTKYGTLRPTHWMPLPSINSIEVNKNKRKNE